MTTDAKQKKAQLVRRKLTLEEELSETKKTILINRILSGLGCVMILSIFVYWSIFVSVAGIVLVIFANAKMNTNLRKVKSYKKEILDLTVEVETQ